MTTAHTIYPFSYGGKLRANASKSYFQRAMAVALLAHGQTTLNQINWAADTKAVHSVIVQLGAKTELKDDVIIITPSEKAANKKIELNVGESGLALRMFSSIVTHFQKEVLLHGRGSLINRPVKPIVTAIKNAGAYIQDTNGALPLLICGPLQGGEFTVDGSFSSQVLSGLLMTLPLQNRDSIMRVNEATSLPYIDMTLEIMLQFGVDVTHENYQLFRIPGNQQYTGRAYDIEGDWSGAANHLVGAAISGDITMTGLNPQSKQADIAILDVLESVGAAIAINEAEIRVCKNSLKPFLFDATNSPDLFPPLVALAAACDGKTTLHGTDRLTYKESNRLETLLDTYSKLGVELVTSNNSLIIHGNGKVRAGKVDSHNDHRIAMSAAICATIADGPITISSSSAVNKSYPDFFEDLNTVSK